jgi:hypothetical protein
MALEHITDHQAQAIARLAEQYKGSASVTGLVNLTTAEHQAIEDALWADFSTTIAASTGAQLDVLGKIVGQPREGRDDPTYRLWAKARVKVNRSGGTAPDIIGIFLALCPGATLRLTEGTGAFVLTVSGVPVTNAPALVTLLRIARAAGVRGLLDTTNATAPGTFTFDLGPGFDVGALADTTE